jgi:hypothetical protein
MTGYRVLAAGRTRILLVASFFYAFSILSILAFAVTLALPNTKAHIPSLFWGLVIGPATFYLLKGSTFAKRFLLAISVISVLTAVPVLWLGNNLLTRSLGVFFGIGGVYSLYMLAWSAEFRSEFNRRRANYEAEKQAAKQKFYDEFEAPSDKGGA